MSSRRRATTMRSMREAHDQRVTVERPLPDPPRGEPALSARAPTKRYGDLVALDSLSFALQPGTITGFLGPNGAGKTTTLRLLLSLARPSAGEALIFGRRYEELE